MRCNLRGARWRQPRTGEARDPETAWCAHQHWAFGTQGPCGWESKALASKLLNKFSTLINPFKFFINGILKSLFFESLICTRGTQKFGTVSQIKWFLYKVANLGVPNPSLATPLILELKIAAIWQLFWLWLS